MDRLDRIFDFIEQHFVKIGCLALTLYVAFWAAIIFVVVHFVAKWW